MVRLHTTTVDRSGCSTRDVPVQNWWQPSHPGPIPYNWLVSSENDKAGELGARLGRAVRSAKPRAKRLSQEAAPRLKKAAEDALSYAREHEDEMKGVAQKLVRSRLRGPLGMAFDALASASGTGAVEAGVCSACQTPNPSGARYCSQCGAALKAEAG
jgi:hypothetical protein